ncbi:sulfite exporter TauE/SafE family protein [Microbacterium sp. LRZ72]|uniref:sulfite exporter TauE/SafE family protein n=1 Tax=Microbacterium sp. LRZ72 TaxID=2942481 RepID=UPI0029B79ABB|nr:sulfite exporter TauE/SafE family protein [Microbacterium sp. LRZ72]MDX2376521.1 sulfite exporter TauE/SafE family protein [Microbacterium sp. LRZ72]
MEVTTAGWALLAVAAIIVGLSKAALPGANTIAVAIFAGVLPARESTAALLLLLIVGDLFALWAYRRHADWRALVRLAPAVVVGLLLGALFLAVADDAWVRRTIGVILLLVIAVTLWRRRAAKAPVPGPTPVRPRWPAAVGYGTVGGFTTMVANAGGPVMSMYFLASGFRVMAFLGTAAWFFALVNLAKVPFAISLGLLTPQTLLLDLTLVPAVLIGAFAGRAIASRIPQAVFERVVIVLTVVGAVYLLL